MMDVGSVSAAIHLVLALIMGMVLLFLLRDYRIDALRERLSTLRDELFVFAESQGSSEFFSEPAYRQLRDTINAAPIVRRDMGTLAVQGALEAREELQRGL